MIKFEFRRCFTEGNLKGIMHTDTITMESIKAMDAWVKVVNKSSKLGKLNYLVFEDWSMVR